MNGRNEFVLPNYFQNRRMSSSSLRSTFLEKYSTDHLANLAKEELEEVWDHYDENHDGMLDENELNHLAHAAVLRVEARLRGLFAKTIKEEAKESKTEKELDAELAISLDAMFSKDVIKQAKEDLVTMLHANSDGKVTKEQFFANWSEFAGNFQQADEIESMCKIF